MGEIMEYKKTVKREYIVFSKELKMALGLQGNIKSIVLYEGLSPDDEEKGVSQDKNKWLIETEKIE